MVSLLLFGFACDGVCGCLLGGFGWVLGFLMYSVYGWLMYVFVGR